MSKSKAQAGQVRIKLVALLLVIEARLEDDHGVFDREPFIVLGRMIEAFDDCERPIVSLRNCCLALVHPLDSRGSVAI